MDLILVFNGIKCIFLWTKLHGKYSAAEAAENFLIKFQILVKYTLKMGKTATVSETENMYDIIYFCFNSW